MNWVVSILIGIGIYFLWHAWDSWRQRQLSKSGRNLRYKEDNKANVETWTIPPTISHLPWENYAEHQKKFKDYLKKDEESGKVI